MYIIELIAKKFLQKKNKTNDYNDVPTFEAESVDNEVCTEHVFMPVDSSGEVLSCLNCGLVVHKSDLHKNNPF